MAVAPRRFHGQERRDDTHASQTDGEGTLELVRAAANSKVSIVKQEFVRRFTCGYTGINRFIRLSIVVNGAMVTGTNFTIVGVLMEPSYTLIEGSLG